MILKSLSFYQSWNFNLTDFLKLRNFYYDLVLLNRRPQNHKNKNVEEILKPSQGAKIVIPHPKQQFLRNSLPPPPRRKKGGHYEFTREVGLKSTKNLKINQYNCSGMIFKIAFLKKQEKLPQNIHGGIMF